MYLWAWYRFCRRVFTVLKNSRIAGVEWNFIWENLILSMIIIEYSTYIERSLYTKCYRAGCEYFLIHIIQVKNKSFSIKNYNGSMVVSLDAKVCNAVFLLYSHISYTLTSTLKTYIILLKLTRNLLKNNLWNNLSHFLDDNIKFPISFQLTVSMKGMIVDSLNDIFCNWNKVFIFIFT